jgi:hypothetical protein
MTVDPIFNFRGFPAVNLNDRTQKANQTLKELMTIDAEFCKLRPKSETALTFLQGEITCRSPPSSRTQVQQRCENNYHVWEVPSSESHQGLVGKGQLVPTAVLLRRVSPFTRQNREKATS